MENVHPLAPLIAVLDSGWLLTLWLALSIACVVWLVYDLRVRNAHLHGLMKVVWFLTVAYSSILGVLVYLFSGRKEIARDSRTRRALRSTAHCYSGCGMGEVIGVVVSVGVFAWGNVAAASLTFVLAYVFGVALTFGPLVQAGESTGTAMWDAVVSESGSIVMMEAVAIGVDLWLAGSATMGQPLFWTSLLVSLSLGFLAAYPVNYLLIQWGIKEGMMNPRHTEASMH